MRRRGFTTLLAALLAATVSIPGATAASRVVTSTNVELVWTLPTASAASSIAFSSTSPHAYVSTFRGLEVLDISTPTRPLPLAELPLLGHSNEAMSLGERGNGEKFVLFASNSAAADTTGYVNPSNKNVTVVEVTDPKNPKVVSHLATPTRTHTASCIDRACTYAYTDGRSEGKMSILDLRDFRNPKVASVPTFTSVVPSGHDEDVDEAGIVWHVGGEGSVALDVSDPEHPVQLNSTNADGARAPWNRFIHHNSHRPNADAFAHVIDANGVLVRDADGYPVSGEPSVENGNVFLVTEEFLGTNLNTLQCPTGAGEGAFQTWYIPFLDAGEYAKANPRLAKGKGTITPLDKWNTELMDTGMAARVPGFCSAHYFDYHHKGVVAQGFYEQGTRLLDVRDAREIKQIGYFFAPGMETWGAYWVPEYNPQGKATGRDSNIVYTADNLRGIDVLRVDLDELPQSEDTKDLRAPILDAWLVPDARLASRRSAEWGYACRL